MVCELAPRLRPPEHGVEGRQFHINRTRLPVGLTPIFLVLLQMPGGRIAEFLLTKEGNEPWHHIGQAPVRFRPPVYLCPRQILLRKRIKPWTLARLGWVQSAFHDLGFL